MTAEKSKLLDRVDTLEAGNEKFMELKESQDREVQHLRSVQQELHNQVGGFEWQLSEKDEQIVSLEEQLTIANEQIQASSGEGNENVNDQIKLKSEVASLRRSLAEMESNCVLLKRQVEEMEAMIQNAMTEKEDMASQLVDTQDKLDGTYIFSNCRKNPSVFI